MRSDHDRLLDIQEAIIRIEKYAAQGRETLAKDELVQTWIVHHLQLIGEAVRTLSSGIKDRYPQVPWVKIIGMRNILVHHYFEVDVDVIWSVMERDLPELKHHVERILEESIE